MQTIEPGFKWVGGWFNFETLTKKKNLYRQPLQEGVVLWNGAAAHIYS